MGAAKLAVGLEVEGAKPLPEELFVELLGFLVPPWDPTRRGLSLGGEDYAERDEEDEEDEEDEDVYDYENASLD